MRVGAFELSEPLPELKGSHALVMLGPWIDVGSVGSLALHQFETHFGMMELGGLAKPGTFFDFTRYRPVISLRKGQREISIPNVRIRYARTVDSFDFIFLHLMEPHMNGELYVDSLLRVLQRLDVRRYVLIGGMYDVVPHTRPLVVSGLATGRAMEDTLAKLNIEASEYHGPTSITSLVFLEAAKLGIDTMGLMVHLPQYVQLEEDYTGAFHLLGILYSIYGISLDLEGVRRR